MAWNLFTTYIYVKARLNSGWRDGFVGKSPCFESKRTGTQKSQALRWTAGHRPCVPVTPVVWKGDRLALGSSLVRKPSLCGKASGLVKDLAIRLREKTPDSSVASVRIQAHTCTLTSPPNHTKILLYKISFECLTCFGFYNRTSIYTS